MILRGHTPNSDTSSRGCRQSDRLRRIGHGMLRVWCRRIASVESTSIGRWKCRPVSTVEDGPADVIPQPLIFEHQFTYCLGKLAALPLTFE